MTQISQSPRTLTIGFEGKTLHSLKKRFDVCCAISEDASAEVNWSRLHSLQVPVPPPEMTSDFWECLGKLRSHYLQFNDINSRRHYYVPGRESETYNGLILTFYKVYELLKANRIELVLHANLPHEGFDFVIYQVARVLKIRCAMCYQSLVPNRFWLTDSLDAFGFFKKQPAIFQKQNSGYRLPDNWFYMRTARGKDASYGVLDLWKETVVRPYRILPAAIRFIYAHQYRVDVKKLTQEKRRDEKYVYFPLHLQPELTTSSVGGVFADQLLAIEALSAWLPPNYFVYLKENPKQTEKQRGPLFYKRLKALKNVRLLSRNQNSVELIQNSVAVATITGTAGWEALFHKKPVIIFGAAWYREFSGVFNFNPKLKFDEVINTQLPESDLLVEELDRALTTAGKGVVDPAYAVLIDGFDEIENAEYITNSLWRYVIATQNSPSGLQEYA